MCQEGLPEAAVRPTDEGERTRGRSNQALREVCLAGRALTSVSLCCSCMIPAFTILMRCLAGGARAGVFAVALSVLVSAFPGLRFIVSSYIVRKVSWLQGIHSKRTIAQQTSPYCTLGLELGTRRGLVATRRDSCRLR